VSPSASANDGPADAGERALALADILRQATQASLDPVAVLEVLARWASRTIGDLAVVRTLTSDGSTLRAGPVAHVDPGAEALAAEELADSVPDPGSLLHRVMQTQEAALTPELIVAPLRSRGRALGTLSLARDPGRPPLRAADLELLDEVTVRVGLVYDNARLYERVRLHAATLEHVDAAVCAVDASGRVTAFNPAAERLFGWTEAELLGRSPSEIVSAEPAEKLAGAREAVRANGRHAAQWRLRRRDGEEFDGHIDTVVVSDDRGRATSPSARGRASPTATPARRSPPAGTTRRPASR
jgi:PAS domain S-box-containing protein